MTFDLVRLGWPNTVAILALAAMPAVSLAIPTGQPALTMQVESIDIQTPRPVVAMLETISE